MPTETFRSFIDGLVARTGTADAVAKAIALTPSAFSRGVRNAGTLGVESLLRLAEWSGEPPDRVLRLGGKGAVASLIAALYGAQTHATLTKPERELVGVWRDLEPDAQHAVSVLLRALAAKKDVSPSRKRA